MQGTACSGSGYGKACRVHDAGCMMQGAAFKGAATSCRVHRAGCIMPGAACRLQRAVAARAAS